MLYVTKVVLIRLYLYKSCSLRYNKQIKLFPNEISPYYTPVVFQFETLLLIEVLRSITSCMSLSRDSSYLTLHAIHTCIFPQLFQGSGPASGTISLNSMTVDAVCEKLKQIEGLEQSMLPQYCATIKKVTYILPAHARHGSGCGRRAETGLPDRPSAQLTLSTQLLRVCFLLEQGSSTWKRDPLFCVLNCPIATYVNVFFNHQ